MSSVVQADAMGDAGRRIDRPPRVRSTVEELRRMRAMLSEQQAEMRTMKQEQQTMKQEYRDEIRKLQTGAHVTSPFE